jgi:hypothetical protein
MTTNTVETSASLDVFTCYSDVEYLGNTVTLQAIRNGVVVAENSDLLNAMWGRTSHLSVSGVDFDTLRLYGSGDALGGDFVGVLDNVVITPEPSALGLVAACALLDWRRGR